MIKDDWSRWKITACLIAKIIFSLLILYLSWLVSVDWWGQPNEGDLISLVKIAPEAFWVTMLFLSLLGFACLLCICLQMIRDTCCVIKSIISNIKFKRTEDKEHD